MSFAPVAILDCSCPCPVCGHHMDLADIETVAWATRTAGERLTLRCAKCGMTRSEWKAVPLMFSPTLMPED
jgi:hypothetical protein